MQQFLYFRFYRQRQDGAIILGQEEQEEQEKGTGLCIRVGFFLVSNKNNLKYIHIYINAC